MEIIVSQCSPEHLIEFGSMKREELEKIANDGKIMGSWSMKKML